MVRLLDGGEGLRETDRERDRDRDRERLRGLCLLRLPICESFLAASGGFK